MCVGVGPISIVIYSSQAVQGISVREKDVEESDRCVQPVTVASEQPLTKVQRLIKEGPQVIENEMKDSINISLGSLNRIFRHHLGVWKRCTL